MIKKLFGGHDIVTAKKDSAKPPKMQPIRVEDLERGLSFAENGMRNIC